MPNLHLIRQLAEKQVAAGGADVLVLPETFNGILCEDDPDAGPIARQFLATLARACGAAVISSLDYQHESGRRANTCFVVDREGNELGTYDKRVLFAREQGSRTPGAGAGIFEIPLASRDVLRVAVLICGDMWDASLVNELRGRADLLCVPAKTTVLDAGHIEYARRLWWNLALTRAMESGLPVVVSDWPEGRHESTGAVREGSSGAYTRVKSVHYTSGGSSITDPGRRPNFNEIQRTTSHGQAGVLAATVDLDSVEAFREHRREVGLLR
jgi:predicted amidohydrolase